jgi:hypothetical protein
MGVPTKYADQTATKIKNMHYMALTGFQVEGVMGGQSIAPMRNRSSDRRACDFRDQCNGHTPLDNHSGPLEDNRTRTPELFPLLVWSIRREWDQRRVQTYAVRAVHGFQSSGRAADQVRVQSSVSGTTC